MSQTLKLNARMINFVQLKYSLRVLHLDSTGSKEIFITFADILDCHSGGVRIPLGVRDEYLPIHRSTLTSRIYLASSKPA